MGPSLVTSLFIQFLCIYKFVITQEYLGCFVDNESRILGHSISFLSLSPTYCIDYCQKMGYTYAGLQDTNCFCGTIYPEVLKTSESECINVCPGNSAQKCGGKLRNNVYKITNPKQSYVYVGCYKDEEFRKLKGFSNIYQKMIPNHCIEICKGMNYLYAGVQTNMCFCGNQLQPSDEKVPDSECNALCEGDLQRKCGGPWRNSIYFTATCDSPCQNGGTCVAPNICECSGTFYGPSCQYEGKRCVGPSTPVNAVKTCDSETCTIKCWEGYEFPDGSTTVNISCRNGEWKPVRGDWTSIPNCKVILQEYLGCYVDDSNRVMKHEKPFAGLTQEMCTGYCQKIGYKYAGLQTSSHCLCGSSLPPSKVSESDCKQKCAGNLTQACGSDWRSSVFKIKNPRKDYEYLGCYKDQDKPRSLSGYYETIYKLTPIQCIDFCKQLNYPYAGLQATNWCFCGNNLPSPDVKLGENGCQMKCVGDLSLNCGGAFENSIYFTGLCTSPCQNGGTCVSSNTCACPENFYGSSCEKKRCVGNRSTPGNAIESCDSETCTIKCKQNYQFPDGSTTVKETCKDGEWVLDKPDWSSIPDCKGHLYQGCYKEVGKVKMFGHMGGFPTNLTSSVCLDYCSNLGYFYFGLQYRSECFCGTILPDIRLKVSESECNLKCSGDNKQICGGSGRNSLYEISFPKKV